MKTWIKYGLIFGAIYLIIVFISWLVSFMVDKFLLSFVYFPCVTFFAGEEGMACIVLGPITQLILIFIIGSIIGLIIQKIKERREQ